MGLTKLQKATLILYEDEREKFLKELQDLEMFHITDSRSSPLVDEYPDLIPDKKLTDKEGEEIFNKIGRVVEIFKPHSNNKGILGQFIDLKTGISPERYKTIVKNFDPDEIMEICKWDDRLYHLHNQLTEFEEKKEFYEEWKKMKTPIVKLEEVKNVIVKIYKIKGKLEDLEEALKDIPVDYSIVFKNTAKIGIVFFIYKGFEKEFNEIISEYGAESVDFRDRERSPKEIFSECRSKMKEIESEISGISKKLLKKSSEFEKYLVLYDYFLSRIKRTEVLNKTLMTKNVFFIEGWIVENSKDVLEKLVSSYRGVDLTWVKPRKDERPPVKLENNKLSEPYEVLTGLYAYPKPNEVDPTPYISLFFAFFFAFCLTDAVYGIALIAISFFLLPKLPEGRKYLWIFIAGGIMTIFAGSLTGGWLGNNLEVAFPAFSGIVKFRNKLMLFDPFKNPLNFLKLSLGFGVLQIGAGLIIAMKERIRKGNYLDAIANEISWFLFFIFVGIGYTKGIKIFIYLGFLPILTILLFSWRSNSWIKQIAKGGFRLFRGLIGFLGDILSYSRIMALGLVTAGLAMSVNILVMIVRDLFPVIGPILAVLVFILGHTFSLAINTLSGFVHTMRLQFAEFFSYFYEGGGEKFEPFGLENRYTRIET